MTSNVTVEEARAILEALRGVEPAAKSVCVRRFDQPLRLPEAELESLRARIAAAAPAVERELALAWRTTPRLEVLELGETSVDGLASSLGATPLVLRFEVAGEPGWLVWERLAALRVLESALGSNANSIDVARELSSVECTLALRWLAAAAKRIAGALGLASEGFRLVQQPALVGSWRDGGPHSDPSRVHVRLNVESELCASAWKLYLPGVMPAPSDRLALPTAGLPSHAARIPIELCARLGASDVPLAQLLELQVGDVIPLGVPVGESLSIHVEDQACLRGVLGRVRGNLALCVTSIERASETT